MKVLSWAFAAFIFAAIGALLTYTYLELHPELLHAGEAEHEEGAEAQESKAQHSPAAASEASAQEADQHEARHAGEAREEETPDVRTLENGDVVVRMDLATQKRIALATAPLTPATLPPELLAYGVVQEDPGRSFFLRAPIAGFLHPATQPWPQLGDLVPAGTTVGVVVPRLSAVERADLAARLAAARGEVDEAQAALQAAQTSYDRRKKLFAEQLESQRQLQEAEATLRAAQAHLETARRTVAILQSSLTASTGPAGEVPLRLERPGQVLAVPARPGEAVESGQSLLQVGDYDQLLVRTEIPVGQPIPSQVKRARIVPAGFEDHPLEGQLVGPLPAADQRLAGGSLLFRVRPGRLLLLPGMFASVYLELPGRPRSGILVPRSAIVRYGGRSWVYLQTQADEFTRKALNIDHAQPGAVFATGGLGADAPLVVQGAQSLLSKELTFSAQEEEE